MVERRKKGKERALPASSTNPAQEATRKTPKRSASKVGQESNSEKSENANRKASPHSTVADALANLAVTATESDFSSRPTSSSQDPISLVVGNSSAAELLLPDFHFLSPGGPLIAESDTLVNFSGFGTFFEPQGELADSIDPQINPLLATQFSTPVPLISQSTSDQPSSVQSTVVRWELQQPTLTADDPSAFEHAADMPSGLKRKPEESMLEPDQGSLFPKRLSVGGGNGSSSRTVTIQVPAAMEDIAPPADSGRPGAANSQERGGDDSSRADTSKKTADLLPKLSPILPPGKVFPIRIGSELFHLSGASISSDAPSYFSHYFGEQLLQSGGKASALKTLYIDRDPVTFREIVLHLQGYHITPKSGEHFVKLFADAQFFSLPRLTRQLFKSDIFIQIGERHFQVPRNLFSAPGDQPNYFSLGFAHFFSTSTDHQFPGVESGQMLLRPRALLPPVVPNRDGDIFADLLAILQGYDVHIRDDVHREQLLRDARYFHLKGLEQRLLPVTIGYNLSRNRAEISMRLEDLRQSGVTFTPDSPKPAGNEPSAADDQTGYIAYQRPFIDDAARELVIETSGAAENARINPLARRVLFAGEVKGRMTNLFSVITSKMGLPANVPLGLMLMTSGGGVARQPISPANSGISDEWVKVGMDRGTDLTLNGKEVVWDEEEEEEHPGPTDLHEWPDMDLEGEGLNSRVWFVMKAQWRIRVEKNKKTGKAEVILVAVKLEAYTNERARNKGRKYLDS